GVVSSLGCARRSVVDRMDPHPHGAFELGGFELRDACDSHQLRGNSFCREAVAQRKYFGSAVDGNRADHPRCDARRPDSGKYHVTHDMTKWILVLMVICATTVGDVCRSLGMRQHGELH